MLQRIQSLYLVAAMTSVLLLFFMPAAEVPGLGNQLYLLRMSGIFRVVPGGSELMNYYWWPLLILLVIITVLFPAAILFYRKRMVQMRLCILVILLLAGLTGFMFYYISVAFRSIGAVEYSYKLTIVLPLIAIILTYLAFRAIRKDEELIRSIDRIR